jgi:hypothetical protein
MVSVPELKLLSLSTLLLLSRTLPEESTHIYSSVDDRFRNGVLAPCFQLMAPVLSAGLNLSRKLSALVLSLDM